jgi:hypothetical protein
MWPFGPKKCCKHDWRTVAFDASFHTQYSDVNTKKLHHIRWLKCKHCDERSFDRSTAKEHRGVEQVRNRWLEQNRIAITQEGEVYDDDYQLASPSTAKNFAEFHYQPITEVDKILRMLADNAEFQELCKHQMVADAFGELETVVKLHENLDK